MAAHFTQNLVAQAWMVGLAFTERVALAALLVRYWGADAYREWVIVLAASQMLLTLELGLSAYFGNLWHRHFEQKDEAAFQHVLDRSLFIYSLLTGLILCAAIAQLWFFDGSPVLALLSLAVLLQVVRGSISQIYRGRGRFARGVWVSSIAPTLILVAGTVCVLADGSALHFAGLIVLCETVATIFLFIDIRRLYPHLRFKWRPDYHFSDVFSHAIWLASIRMSQIAWLQGPVLVAGLMVANAKTVVGFLLLRTMVGAVRMGGETLLHALLVNRAGPFQLRNWAENWAEIRVLILPLSLGVGAILGGMMAHARGILELWVGEEALFQMPVLVAMIAGLVVSLPALPLKTALTYANLPRAPALASLVQVVLGLVFSCIGVMNFGMVGMVVGLALGEIIAFVLLFPALAGRDIDVPLFNSLLFANVACAVMVLVSYLVAQLSGLLWAFGFVGLVWLSLSKTVPQYR